MIFIQVKCIWRCHRNAVHLAEAVICQKRSSRMTYWSCMLKRCLRFREGNMRKEPWGKLRVVSSQNWLWYSKSAQSTQNSAPVLLASSGQLSHRNPPRIRVAHRELDLQTLTGQASKWPWRMSISQLSPETGRISWNKEMIVLSADNSILTCKM